MGLAASRAPHRSVSLQEPGGLGKTVNMNSLEALGKALSLPGPLCFWVPQVWPTRATGEAGIPWYSTNQGGFVPLGDTRGRF